jgi:hypothetical protein
MANRGMARLVDWHQATGRWANWWAPCHSAGTNRRPRCPGRHRRANPFELEAAPTKLSANFAPHSLTQNPEVLRDTPDHDGRVQRWGSTSIAACRHSGTWPRKLARTVPHDQKSPDTEISGRLKRERRIIYADSRHRSPVRPSAVSLSPNDLPENRGAERPLVPSGGRSIQSTSAANRKPQKRQTRALNLIRS